MAEREVTGPVVARKLGPYGDGVDVDSEQVREQRRRGLPEWPGRAVDPRSCKKGSNAPPRRTFRRASGPATISIAS
jgi:hypothetical protein